MSSPTSSPPESTSWLLRGAGFRLLVALLLVALIWTVHYLVVQA